MRLALLGFPRVRLSADLMFCFFFVFFGVMGIRDEVSLLLCIGTVFLARGCSNFRSKVVPL